MKVIDTNALLILIYGLVNPELISKTSRTRMYGKDDFLGIMEHLKNDLSKLIILPNVWTEVSNLIHNRSYLDPGLYNIFHTLARESKEMYYQTKDVLNYDYFQFLGITDSALLMCAINGKKYVIISADSSLIDRANSLDIKCYDVVLEMNKRRLRK